MLKFRLQLDENDYILYLKDIIYRNSIYQLIRLMGFLLIILALWRWKEANWVFYDSLIGILFISFCMLSIRQLSLFRERLRFKKSNYYNDLISEHELLFTENGMEMKVGNQDLFIKMSDFTSILDTQHFFIVEIMNIRLVPFAKYKISENELNSIKRYIYHYMENREIE